MDRPILLLCGGLQNSGSTLVSWCFLQRRDTDGVLDACNDELFVFPEDRLKAHYHWCKFTVGCFGFHDLRAFYADAGFRVMPLLVVRDTRSVFRSLLTKNYGRNGLTAEDPPLRMRMRRFKRDWKDFRAAGWPMLRFESLVGDPEITLHAACTALGLDWDPDMLTWPKLPEQVSFFLNGNATFQRSRQGGLATSLQPDLAHFRTDGIPIDDLRWLEENFYDFNVVHGYPLATSPAQDSSSEVKLAVPTMLHSRRTEAMQQSEQLRRRCACLAEENALLLAETAHLRRQISQQGEQLSGALARAALFEEVRHRLERFEGHFVLGPAIRCRRKALEFVRFIKRHRIAG